MGAGGFLGISAVGPPSCGRHDLFRSGVLVCNVGQRRREMKSGKGGGKQNDLVLMGVHAAEAGDLVLEFFFVGVEGAEAEVGVEVVGGGLEAVVGG
jgi:hypothetical protein